MIGQRDYLSDNDIEAMNIRYGLKIIAIRGINLAVNELGSIEVDVIAPLDNHYYVGIWDESGTMSPPWDWVNDYSFWSGNIGSQKIALSAAQNYTFIFDVKPTTSSETFNFSLYKRGWFFFYLGIDNIEFNLTTNGLEANSLAKEGDENLLPVQYEAFQNYPNPFNPVTQIKYSIPERSEVTLKVYNVLGKEVATLVNEEKEPGYYTVDFDGSNLASGMYIYRITAGSFIETRKMILMK
ncbi:MAG: T9SS type A sorting domain-containing protein [Ignavibacteriales bacterium]|nr:T9SS type A sorting domain-containing protein [Ignavibacteriales bacterium]